MPVEVIAGEEVTPPVVATAATVVVFVALMIVAGKLKRDADDGAELSFTELAKDDRLLGVVTKGIKEFVVGTAAVDCFEVVEKSNFGIEDTVAVPPEAVDFAKEKAKLDAEDVTATLDAEEAELADEKIVPPKLVCPRAEVDLATGSVKGRAMVEVLVEDLCS